MTDSNSYNYGGFQYTTPSCNVSNFINNDNQIRNTSNFINNNNQIISDGRSLCPCCHECNDVGSNIDFSSPFVHKQHFQYPISGSNTQLQSIYHDQYNYNHQYNCNQTPVAYYYKYTNKNNDNHVNCDCCNYNTNTILMVNNNINDNDAELQYNNDNNINNNNPNNNNKYLPPNDIINTTTECVSSHAFNSQSESGTTSWKNISIDYTKLDQQLDEQQVQTSNDISANNDVLIPNTTTNNDALPVIPNGLNTNDLELYNLEFDNLDNQENDVDDVDDDDLDMNWDIFKETEEASIDRKIMHHQYELEKLNKQKQDQKNKNKKRKVKPNNITFNSLSSSSIAPITCIAPISSIATSCTNPLMLIPPSVPSIKIRDIYKKNEFEGNNKEQRKQRKPKKGTKKSKHSKYKCTELGCTRLFKHKTNLKIHRRIHQPNCPQCRYCKKRFARELNLKQHERVHTGEKPYKCDLCDQTFKQSHSLKDHKRIHSGEKPYECPYCRKRFAILHNQKSHLRIHRKEFPHQCALCDKEGINKVFRQKSSLNTHTKKEHPLHWKETHPPVVMAKNYKF